MTAQTLLEALTARGVQLILDGSGIVAKPASRLTDADRQAIRACKAELRRLLEQGAAPEATRPANVAHNADLLDASDPAAVLLHSSVLNHAVWLVADAAVLTEHPDIEASGFPVFFFDEVERLRALTPDELRQLCMVKAAFPGARMVQ
ncbi:MAG: hypothetical protein ABSA52_21780 [Candidatus Binatia bacterium]|jgi:hypothetical protein